MSELSRKRKDEIRHLFDPLDGQILSPWVVICSLGALKEGDIENAEQYLEVLKKNGADANTEALFFAHKYAPRTQDEWDYCWALAEGSLTDLKLLQEMQPHMEAEIANSRKRAKGTNATRQRANKRHEEIMKKATEVDLKRKYSANALADILVEELKVRRSSPSKKKGAAGYSECDTSYNAKGFKKSSIYGVLKANGWK